MVRAGSSGRAFPLVSICVTTESLRTVTTERLRACLSEIINRAAYGSLPVVVTRRGHPVAAVISIEDLAFLSRMRRMRDAQRRQPVPSDPTQVGPALAQKLEDELSFR
jgi:prevent-host-death family protein